jgi:hypothetical protein
MASTSWWKNRWASGCAQLEAQYRVPYKSWLSSVIPSYSACLPQFALRNEDGYPLLMHLASSGNLDVRRNYNQLKVKNQLDIFRKYFLGASTWAQRKDGVPLDLLDNLTPNELKTAETELIKSACLGDTWRIIGLGHIKSKNALPTLYFLFDKSNKGIKVTIAHSIFQICQDAKMIDVVLEEMPKITNQYELIGILYLLPTFHDERVTTLLKAFRDHKEYLVAYNATKVLGLPTEIIVEKFRNKDEPKGFWGKLFG